MARKDLRKEQIELLRFEKKIIEAAKEKAAGKPINKAPLLAGVAALTTAGASAAEKLNSDAPMQMAADIQAAAGAQAAGDAWLVQLAHVVTNSHNVIQNLAEQGAFLFFQAGGGTPKKPIKETVVSLLTNGLF
ncbi:hypothetical protein [Hyphococcus sp.]|uniref:hypothetical protein n=1 Tax=Hyphococcus sp. TaxID=2038636 RepID=UPI003CCBBB51